MKAKLIFIIFLLLKVLYADQNNLEDPESALHYYVEGLREANITKIYQSSQNYEDFTISGPVDIVRYEIIKKELLNEKSNEIESGALSSDGKFLKGDIKLEVLFFIKDTGTEYNYLIFRKYHDSSWKLISNYVYGSP